MSSSGRRCGAACGQLVGDVEDQTRRQERHARRAEARQNEAPEHSGQSSVERAQILASTGKAATSADPLVLGS